MRNPQNDTRSVRSPSRSREGRPLPPSRSREGPGEGLFGPSDQEDEPAPNPSRKREGDAANVPERTCILTRRKGTRDSLIRLALGPDGQVGPDVRARAPGRGAWISVGRGELDAANAKGKLKDALARAFKTGDLQIPADLGEQIERALRQAALDRLGLEARGGTLINGSDRIETAARSGKVHLLIHAGDAREDGRRTLDQALRVGGQAGGGEPRGLIFPEDRTILSMALGRENVVHIALTDAAAASRVSNALVRWRTFTDPRTGLERGVPASAPGSAEEDDEGIE